jgi:hypothetical protein
MKLRMRESKFGAPEGTYLGTFLGLKVMKDDGKPRLGQDGRPMEPGMEWQFEITDDPDHDGANVGQQVGRITSQAPTELNACGVLLRGLLGRKIEPDEEVDTAPFVGQLYRITIGPQRNNPEKTQVIQLARVRTGPAPTAPAPKPPPPRPPARPAPAPAAPPQVKPERYWVQKGEGEPELLAVHEVNAWLAEVKVPPDTVAACQEDAQGEDAWRTLGEFGFKDAVPF